MIAFYQKFEGKIKFEFITYLELKNPIAMKKNMYVQE